jgi:hypothetical protein
MVLFPYQFFHQVLVLIPYLLPWLNDEKTLGQGLLLWLAGNHFLTCTDSSVKDHTIVHFGIGRHSTPKGIISMCTDRERGVPFTLY